MYISYSGLGLVHFDYAFSIPSTNDAYAMADSEMLEEVLDEGK